MRRRGARGPGRTGLELVEDAFHLLRRAPASTLAVYAAGALPFLMGLLAFTADMSGNPFADERLGGEALALVVLFLWMKVCQAQFARRLRSHASGDAAPRWSVRRSAHDLFLAAAIQPSGLFAIPAAAALILPLPWAFAFYQNAAVGGDAAGPGLTAAIRLAAMRAPLRARQNYAALLVLALLGLFVFANAALALIAVPYLARSLFGIESTFTLSGEAAVSNSTFLAAALAIAWACLDPLVKAVYVLRCLEADVVETGEDLRAEFRAAFRSEKALALLLLLAFLPRPLDGAQSGPPGTAIRPPDLDRALARVLERSEYTWRTPRTRVEREVQLPGFLESIGNFFDGIYRRIVRWWNALRDWLRKLLGPEREEKEGAKGTAWIASTNLLLLSLLAAVASAAAVLILRSRRRRDVVQATVLTLPAGPDAADDGAAAASLPEADWRLQAAALAAQGDFRTATRFLYLGSLALLSARRAITLARHKSNRDYARELQRRLRGEPELSGVFEDNVFQFERVWYGRHAAGPETLVLLGGNLDRLQAGIHE
jgi:hypothetical protein